MKKPKIRSLGELKDHTKLLQQIATNTGGAGSGGTGNTSLPRMGGMGGIFGNIFGGIFGGGGVGIGGNQPGYPIAMNSTGEASGDGTSTTSGGSIWKQIKGLFGTGEGGIFAPRENVITGKTSALGGIMGGIGTIAAVAGGMIGGKWGNVLAMAGTGASIGAMFGPIGAAVGAGIGALIGLFGGDPKKKRDKNEHLPQLQKGFTEALQALRDMAANKNAILSDPEGSISKAMELRSQIASGFGVQFESKKYRQIAQQQITQKLAEADVLIAEIKKFAEVAGVANEREKRLLPEFADGGAVSNFARQNGMETMFRYSRMDAAFSCRVPGVYDRKDDFIARLTGNEVVLTPDVWMPITHYLKARNVPGFAEGGAVGTVPRSTPANTAGGSNSGKAEQNIVIQLFTNHTGIVESDVEKVLVDGLKKENVQVEIVKAYDKTKRLVKNGS